MPLTNTASRRLLIRPISIHGWVAMDFWRQNRALNWFSQIRLWDEIPALEVQNTCASADTPWVAYALSHFTPVRYGRIAFISAAHDATQFGDFIYPICISTFQMLVQQGSTDTGLNRHRRGLPPWSSKYQIRPLPFLPIQYSPFSFNCPARSHFKPFYQLFKFSTFQSRTRV
jgi:hypothetical protein